MVHLKKNRSIPPQMKTFFLMVRKHIAVLIRNVVCSEEMTCYPELPRKSRAVILLDNLVWLLHFGHANRYYYILGLDRKKTPAHMQKNISGRRSKTIRNRRKRRFCKDHRIYTALIHDKFVASQYIESLGFPVPKTLALVFNESILFPKTGVHLPLSALWSDPSCSFHDCICKPVADGQGRGVFHLEGKDDQIFVNNQRVEHQRLSGLFARSRYIIQERVLQHPKMSTLNPSCVNTIRLVTCFHDGVVIPFSAAVRIGRKGNVTDNWHTGGIIIRLNMETGCLDRHGFTLPEYGGKKHAKHPETGVVFEGYEIPFCHQAVELATRLHRYFYGTHSIGWDIAITEKGPVFIEGNQNWDPYVHVVVEDYFMDQFKKYFM